MTWCARTTSSFRWCIARASPPCRARLRVDLSGWDTDIGNLKDWYREA